MIYDKRQAREKLLSGINKTADVVKSTMGAKGSTVLITGSYLLPSHITKDGITVANAVTLPDNVEQEGCILVRTASKKTVDEAGDSTTTTAVLTQAMCNKAHLYLNLGQDVNVLKKNLREDLDKVKKYLSDNSIKIKNTDDIRSVAMVSSNYDDEVCDIIKQIYDECGFNVAIDCIEGDTEKCRYEKLSGLILPNSGWASEEMMNNFDKGRIEYENPEIYVMNTHIREQIPESLFELIDQHIREGCETPKVLFVNYIDDGPLRGILNLIRDGRLFNFSIVLSNLIYDVREDRFKDICAYTKAKYAENKISTAGTCGKIVIEKKQVTIFNGPGSLEKRKKELEERISKLKTRDISLEQRLLSLNSNAALIIVGGKLQNAIKERKDRVEDAVLSVKSALEEGYCAGGGSVFIHASKNLDLSTDIMKYSLSSCYRTIMDNAGVDPNHYFHEIISSDKPVIGYDVNQGKVVNMVENEIIDSVKSLRVSLENAVDTTITFMNINSIIDLKGEGIK